MENITLRYVFDKNKKAKSQTDIGPLSIEVRIVGTNKCAYITTGIKIKREQFSDKNGFTCIKHDKANMVTAKARSIYNQVESFVLSDKCLRLQDVHNWNKTDVCTYSPVQFIKERLAIRNPSFDVVEYHNSLIKRIEEFGRFKTFDDLTYLNILDFDAHLRKTITSQPTLYKRHTAFKSYIVMAIKAGLCKYNPYDDFTYKKGKSKDPVFLTEDELKKIHDYIPESDKLKRIKDLFLFQCYTGMAYIDAISFDKSYISIFNGKEIIRSSRTKTDESFISLLLPQAKEILTKYNYQLPKISNVKYNDYLKLIAAGAGVNKNITTHVARHTYATYLLNKDIPIETVSRAIGHATIKQTQHYARMLGKKVIQDMEILLTEMGDSHEPPKS